tara:strand:- start:12 stop:614 length:603 start_codon:yes stop_codon:yes gene_type:complete
MSTAHTLLSKLAAVTLLLLVAAAAIAFGLRPLWDAYRDGEDEIAQLEAHLVRFQQMAAEKPALVTSARNLAMLASRNDYVLAEGSASFAAASLQARVRAALQEHGGLLESVRVLTPQQQGPFIRVTINAQLFTTMNALGSMLHEIETAEPYVVVNQLTINSREVSAVRELTSTGAEGPARPAVALEVSMIVSGLILGEGL